LLSAWNVFRRWHSMDGVCWHRIYINIVSLYEMRPVKAVTSICHIKCNFLFLVYVYWLLFKWLRLTEFLSSFFIFSACSEVKPVFQSEGFAVWSGGSPYVNEVWGTAPRKKLKLNVKFCTFLCILGQLKAILLFPVTST